MDFKQLVRQAEQGVLTAQERKERGREREVSLRKAAETERIKASEEAAAELRQIWLAVLESLLSRQPPHDLMVLDALRLAELPSRLPDRRGWRQSSRVAKWIQAADRISVPAWDMLATFRIGGYFGETYRVVPYEMYLGGNGVVYCNPRMQDSNGAHADWEASFNSAEEVPGIWRPRVAGPHDDAIDGRQEVAIGLARLVAKHSLEIDAMD
jgi:hypothetical protein